MMLTKYLPLIASAVPLADGFAFGMFDAFKASPVLSEVSEYKIAEKFTVSLDVGDKEDAHMNLNGLTIEMLQEPALKDEQVHLPGHGGPHPQISSGPMALKIHSTPSFIDMFGTQKVRFEKGCYEMIWKKDYPCGSIVCGFNLPMGAKRNGANLPAGLVNLYFPLWKAEGLATKQAEKFEAELKVKELSQERDEEMQKYISATNLLKKALHYRNAVAAVEQIDFTGIRSLSRIPSMDEVIPIGNGLLLQTTGNVWTKGSGFMGKSTLLGEAKLATLVEEPATTLLRP